MIKEKSDAIAARTANTDGSVEMKLLHVKLT
jgi:hypothetical protein